MMPIVDFGVILEFFKICVHFIQTRRAQRDAASEMEEDLSIAANFLYENILQWFEIIRLLFIYLKLKRRKRRLYKPHLLIQILAGYRRNSNSNDVWEMLQKNWVHFFSLTGETPQTLKCLVKGMQDKFIHVTFRKRQKLDFKNQILMTMIWLRCYPTMHILGFYFGVTVGCVHKILHKCMKILHGYIVPKYIKWHRMDEWRKLSGIYPEWPRVVAILDCTPFRICRPTGAMQRIFYRKDRHCFFLNFLNFLNWVPILENENKLSLDVVLMWVFIFSAMFACLYFHKDFRSWQTKDLNIIIQLLFCPK